MFAHDKRLLEINTPDEYIKNIPVGITVPQFFLAAGADDLSDVQNAEYFRQLLLLRVADVPPVDIVSGGGHQAMVWRSALTPMLEWMTAGLSWQVQHFGAGEITKPGTHSVRKAGHLPPKTAHPPVPRATT